MSEPTITINSWAYWECHRCEELVTAPGVERLVERVGAHQAACTTSPDYSFAAALATFIGKEGMDQILGPT